MTTILVATDFPANAHWAMIYALELARQLKGRLVLVHAYTPFLNVTMSPNRMNPKTQEQHKQALQQLSLQQAQLLELTNSPVAISVVARPGSPTHCIMTEAADQKADLLVMGLAGDEPLKAQKLGSLATDMILHTTVPMLLVPPGATYHKPQKIVLAVNLSKPVDVAALSKAKHVAQLLDARLDVLCMEDEPDESLRKAAERVKKILAAQWHTIHFLSGNNLSVALEHYLAGHLIDLIMLLPRSHSRLRTFWLESNTQGVARSTTVPVLSVV